MSYHERGRHHPAYRALQKMDIETKELAAELVLSAILAAFVFVRGGDPAIHGALIAFIHGVKVSKFMEAYARIKREDRLREQIKNGDLTIEEDGESNRVAVFQTEE